MPRVTLGDKTYELPTRGLSISQRQLIECLVERVHTSTSEQAYVDVADYGFNTAAIRAAVAAAVANGTRHIRFSRGTYTTSLADALSDVTPSKYAVSIPSNFLVDGELGHVILQTGLGEAPEGASPAYDVFRTHEPVSYVVFRNLNFRGEKPKDAWHLNHQSAAIGTGSDIHAATVPTDILVENCTFEDLWGFTVHSPGLGERIHVIGGSVTDCANGQNVNADHSIQAFTTFLRSEGIEASSKYSAFIGNVFEDCKGCAMSIGGAGEDLPGCTIVGNVVNGSDAHGIIVGGGLQYASIAGNTMRKCVQHGFLVSVDEFGAPVEGLAITGNVVIDCAKVGMAGFAVHGGAKHVITGNVAISTGDPVFIQRCGLSITAPDCIVSGNVCKGGGPQPVDMSISETALRTHLGQNACLTGSEQVYGTIAPDRRSWPASDIVIAQDRLWNGPMGSDPTFARVLHRRFASGKMEWGDGLEVVDTNLYRSAANVLKTDDKFVAAGGIGVGNSAAASTLGTVTRKVQIFDASGNSLGYIAVYDAIS